MMSEQTLPPRWHDPRQAVAVVCAVTCVAAAGWLGEATVPWSLLLVVGAGLLCWIGWNRWLWAGLIAYFPIALLHFRHDFTSWLQPSAPYWPFELGLIVGSCACAIALGLALHLQLIRRLEHQQQPILLRAHHIDHQRAMLQEQLDRYPTLFESCLALTTVRNGDDVAGLLSETCREILPEDCSVWLFLNQDGVLHCLSAQGPQDTKPNTDIIRYVAQEQRLQVDHSDHEVFAAIPLRADRRAQPLESEHQHRRGVLAVRFQGQGLDNHLILEILTTLGRLGGIGLASVDLLQEAQQVALRDDLTKLYGRHEMMRRLSEAVAKAQRGDKRLSVLLADLDYLKKVNDKFGHHAGDRAIQAVAECLRTVMPQDATLCRYGGEEFAVVLTDAGMGTMGSLAEEFVQQLRQVTYDPERPQHRITASVGYAAWHDGESGWDLLQRADQACYQAKDDGRNRAVAAT